MEQLESDDYFQVLGLARDASETEVRRAYKRLAVQWHPDKNRAHPRAEEFFKNIAEAYTVLSDPEQRRRYEQFGKSGVDSDASPECRYYYGGGGRAQTFDPFAFSGGFSSRHAYDIFEAFFGGADPFQELFGRMGTGGGRRHGRGYANDEWNHPMAGMGFGGMAFAGMNDMGFGSFGLGGMHRGGGFGGSLAMMDSFFGDSGFGTFGSFGAGAGGVGGSFSTSVSTSTFTDRNGHVVTNKTTTTVDASGNRETVTEEFRDGKLTSSTSSSTSRLADAGRMHLESSGRDTFQPSVQASQRGSSSRSRSRRGVTFG